MRIKSKLKYFLLMLCLCILIPTAVYAASDETNVVQYTSSQITSGEYKEPTRKGYTFEGWYLDEACSAGKEFDPVAQISKIKKNTDVYPKWVLNEYTITYELNGGTNPSGATSKYNIEGSVTLPTPTKSGYVFKGWYTKSDFSGSTVTSISKGSTGNKTFYAKWQANVKVTLNYNDGVTESQVVTAGNASELPKPTREGYEFNGWWKGGMTEIEVDEFLGVDAIEGGETGTFELIKNENGEWVNPNMYYDDLHFPITYAVAPITLTEDSTLSFKYKYEGVVTAMDFAAMIIYNGTLDNLGLEGEGEEVYTFQVEASASEYIQHEVELKSGNYIVMFGVVNYSAAGELIGTETSYIKFYLKDLKYTGVGLTEEATGSFTEDTELIAKWTPIEYNINYRLNGGTLPDGSATKYTPKQNVTLPNPIKEGYEFAGWYDNSDFSGEVITNIPQGSMGNKTYYAKWNIQTYAAVYDGTQLVFGRGDIPLTYTYDKAGVSTAGTLTESWTNIENVTYLTTSSVPWYTYRQKIVAVDILNEINPVSTRYWFYYFDNCAKFNLVKLNTSRTTTMQNMFWKAGSEVTTLELLGLEDFDTSNVTDMSSMFGFFGQNATNLTELDLSSWNISNTSDISDMFSYIGSDYLEVIKTPKNINSNVKHDDITDKCWYDINNNYEIYGPGNFPTGNEQSITLVSARPTYAAIYDSTQLVLGQGKAPTTYTYNLNGVSKTGTLTTSWTNIENNDYNFYSQVPWYKQREAITSVNVLDELKPHDLGYWFYEFLNCEIFNVSKLDTSFVTDMNSIFYKAGYNVDNLQFIGLDTWNTSNVTTMQQAFRSVGYNADFNLDSIKNWDTSGVYNLSYMFAYAGCNSDSFTELDLSNWDIKNANNIKAIFYDTGTKSLTTIKTPYNIKDTADIENITSRTWYDLSDDGRTYEAGTFPTGITESHILSTSKVPYITLAYNDGVTSNSIVKVKTSSELPTPTRSGYTFDGWYVAEKEISSDISNLTFTNPNSDYSWVQDINGIWSSNNKGVHSSTSNMLSNEFTVNNGGILTFDWRSNGENNYDYLGFDIYNVTTGKYLSGKTTPTYSSCLINLKGKASSEFSTVEYKLEEGTYKLLFMYGKDSSASSNEDKGFVKNIQIRKYTGNYVMSNTPAPSTFEDDLILMAKWKIPTYKVTLDNQSANSAGTTAYWYEYGTTKEIDGETIYYYKNAECTDPLKGYTITKPSKTGYTFGGYYTGKNGSGTQYVNANGTCIGNLYNNVKSNITLYAKWTPNVYKVTLDNQGATSAGTTAYWYQYKTTKQINGETIYYYKNSACSDPLTGYTITLPTKSGATFGGYFTGKDGTGTQYVNAKGQCINNLYGAVAGNSTLYAYWIQSNYSITYNTNTGLPEGYKLVSYVQSSGTQYIDLGVKTNQDSRFVIEASYTGPYSIYGAGQAYTNFTANSTGGYFYYDGYNSRTTPVKDYSNAVHVFAQDKNKCYIDGELIHTYTASTWTSPQTMILFGRNGSSGFNDAGGTTRIYGAQLYDNGTLIRNMVPCINASGTIGMYDTVNDKFYSNAGSGAFTTSGETYPTTYETGKTLTLSQPSRFGYEFGGWYTNAEFTGTPITEITSSTKGDLTLYAKWESNPTGIHYGEEYSAVINGYNAAWTFYEEGNFILTANGEIIEGVDNGGCTYVYNGFGVVVYYEDVQLGIITNNGNTFTASNILGEVVAVDYTCECIDPYDSYVHATGLHFGRQYYPEGYAVLGTTIYTPNGTAQSSIFGGVLGNVVNPNYVTYTQNDNGTTTITKFEDNTEYGTCSADGTVITLPVDEDGKEQNPEVRNNYSLRVGSYYMSNANNSTNLQILFGEKGNCTVLSNRSENEKEYAAGELNFKLNTDGTTTISEVSTGKVIGTVSKDGHTLNFNGIVLRQLLPTLNARYISEYNGETIVVSFTRDGVMKLNLGNDKISIFGALATIPCGSGMQLAHTGYESPMFLELGSEVLIMNNKYFYLEGTEANNPTTPGLYDINNNILASWSQLVNTYGLVIEEDYTTANSQGTLTYIINNNASLKSGTKLILPEGITRIGNRALQSCNTLTKVILPDSLTSIGSYAFAECTKLDIIVIPYAVQNIEEGAFENCISITNIILNNGGLKTIGKYAFRNSGAGIVYYDQVYNDDSKYFAEAVSSLKSSGVTVGTDAFKVAIDFYIEGFDGNSVTFHCPYGYTWTQFVDSIYDNTKEKLGTDIYISGGAVYHSGGYVALEGKTAAVTSSKVIADGDDYILRSGASS